MDATKETFVFTLAAAALALLLNHLWYRYLDASAPPGKTSPIQWAHLAAALGVWLLVAVVLFSSFFRNASGPLDSLRTYVPWLQRAGGASPHIHPWYFYLHRLLWFHLFKGPIWSEALILALGVIGAIAGFRRRRLAGANAGLVRFLAFYTFLLTAIYCALPYKTPWCLLSFWHGMILLAGVGAVVLVRALRRRAWRVGCTSLLLVGAGRLAWQAWQADTTYAADPRNPYVYSQTIPDILRLVAKVDALASVLPQPDQLVIKVMSPEDDYWPLPWYLRRFKNVGWWHNIPADPYAPVMLVAARIDAQLDENKTHIMNGVYHLRPQFDFELYIDLNLWRAYLEKHPPKRDEE
jgi:predicted membrane-bound mannosyltransferase